MMGWMGYLVAGIAVWFAACGSDAAVREEQAEPGSPAVTPEPASVASLRADALETAPPPATFPSPDALQSMWAEQKRIRSARLRVEVDDVDAALRVAESLARQLDATVTDVHVSRLGAGRTGEFMIRVASARFDEMLERLRTLGAVRSESITSEDVTKEYTDLGTRLAVKEEAVARLRALLLTRTGSLADVLAVERELTRAVTELEQLKGERRYYDERIAVSSIAVSVFDRGAGDRTGFAGRVRAAFRQAADVLGQSISILVYAVTFVIPWALIAVGAWVIASRVRKRRAAPPSAPPA